MELLTGEYRNTLDEKGRIIIPTRLRNELNSSELVVTQSLDRCIWIFPPEEWKKLSQKIMESASPFNAQNRLVVRRIIGPAQEIELDKSGRLNVPQSLLEYANLSKDCVILGVNKYVELWDATSYRSYLEETEDSFREAAEDLADICF